MKMHGKHSIKLRNEYIIVGTRKGKEIIGRIRCRWDRLKLVLVNRVTIYQGMA